MSIHLFFFLLPEHNNPQLPNSFLQQFQGFDSSLRDGEWHRQLFQRICREHPQYRHSNVPIFWFSSWFQYISMISMLDYLILSWLHEGRLKCPGCSWDRPCTNPSLQASTICRLTLLHVDVDSEALNMTWRGHQRASLRCLTVTDGCSMLHALELYDFCHAWGMSKDVQRIESLRKGKIRIAWYGMLWHLAWHERAGHSDCKAALPVLLQRAAARGVRSGRQAEADWSELCCASCQLCLAC